MFNAQCRLVHLFDASARKDVQNAIKSSVNTQEIRRNFDDIAATKIREQLKQVERNFNLGKIDKPTFIKQSLLLIEELSSTGAVLTTEEQQFLDVNTGKTNFVGTKRGDVDDRVLKIAEGKIKEAN
eukprot:TRINITY_DN227_c0_g1_i7.p1 TRINITY_DN227_c0_g1~~TRINITY_DN227_c0_g1_i7.p1  ORF type:complete len:126 (-),score=40.40 TRINITY_DN227_c0_g1_i7:53-430(-)